MTAPTPLRSSGHPGRLLPSLLAGLALAALALPAALAADPAGKAEKPAWPAHVRVVEARLSFKDMQGEIRLGLPQLRAYDRAGRQLYSATGYDSDHFKPDLGALLASKKARGEVDPKATLAADLAKIESPEGKPLAAPPPADVTLVKYWADWCVPCHAQTRELVEVLAAHPGVKVTLVNVEADPSKQRPKQAG
jgi:thiol-disulfide isomerase/thioredoxin